APAGVAHDQDAPPLSHSLEAARGGALHVSEALASHHGQSRLVTIIMQVTRNQENNPSGLAYLDDLHVGQRFTSATHALDERQITAFARAYCAKTRLTEKDSKIGRLIVR